MFPCNSPGRISGALHLTLMLTEGGQSVTANSWDVWAYPSDVYNGGDIAVYDPTIDWA